MKLVLAAALVAACFAVPAHASAEAACTPPRGPGNAAVHSRDLRVVGITCATGRRVALACTRFTHGHAGTCPAAHYRWYCTSTAARGLSSKQRCVAGRRVMTIVWLD